MANVENYIRPGSLEEAWKVLCQAGATARVIGGGVDLALFVPKGITTLVDVSALSSDCVEESGGGLEIGAGVTLTELAECPCAANYLDGILVEVLRKVASPLLRNLATVGGTLASAHPWSDVIPVFIALGAEVELYEGEIRTVLLEELVADRAGAAGALIRAVRLPPAAGDAGAAFEKFTRTGFDVGMLNCACYVAFDQGVCAAVRIALGGTPDMAARVKAVEELVVGTTLDETVIDAAAERVAETVPARDDQRASGEYRRVLAAAGVRRCLKRIAQGMGLQTGGGE
ncbi:FAD binding domain-containing protein [Candidatus Bipolaricaulota bacterium]|nr:FAD binding domain-containing protein [Candidatus Bipolaricaulota bacterium]